MNERRTRRTLSFTLLLALACLAATPRGASPLAASPDKEQDRARIFELFEQGLAARNEEKANPGDAGLRRRRVAVFVAAAAAQNNFVFNWATDPQSLEYVVERYRLGVFLELAERYERARRAYEVCLRLPLVGEAIWDSQPLRPQAQERLRQLSQLARAGERRERETVIIIEHMKGMIRPLSVSLAKAPEKLSERDAQAVAARLNFTTDPRVALAAGREPLRASALLQPVTEASEGGIVVFGIRDRVGGASRLARQLDAVRRRLAAAYFDAGPTQPVVTVYANFEEGCNDSARSPAPAGGLGLPHASAFRRRQSQQSQQSQQSGRMPAQAPHGGMSKSNAPACPEAEAIGQALSQALHFRKMENAEGYFEPLDNSVVVRKGLTYAGGFFFGTATHELTHALVHLDFPQAPPWLDEGLAAMHEEYHDPVGNLPPVPLDNYRLYYLRFALDAGKFPSLETLLDSDSAAWRGQAQPVMAAAARYFCIYLLERERGRSLLKRAYEALRDGPQDAGTPAKVASARVLEQVTGKPLDAIESDFRAFVRARDLGAADSRWQTLRDPIKAVVSKLPDSSPK